MKIKRGIRPYAVIKWVVSFAFMLSIVGATLPTEDINIHLEQIEESIINKDWNQAKMSMEVLKTIYNSNKVLTQGNNATEIFLTLDYILGELDTLIQNEQESALEYINGLKASIEY